MTNLGDRDWQHPEHIKGIKPQKVFDNCVLGPLTDRQIDRYATQGFYSNRRRYRRELRKIRKVQEVMRPKEKRMVYNIETQEVEEREF